MRHISEILPRVVNDIIDRQKAQAVRCTDIESARQADAEYIAGLRAETLPGAGEAACRESVGEGEA